MGIKIKLNLTLKELTGNQDSILVEGNTVIQCLEDYIRKYPAAREQLFNKDGSLALLVLLNNEPLPRQDLNYPVADNDELWLLSIVSGG